MLQISDMHIFDVYEILATFVETDEKNVAMSMNTAQMRH